MPACVGRHVHSDDSAVHCVAVPTPKLVFSLQLHYQANDRSARKFRADLRANRSKGLMSRESRTSDQAAKRCAVRASTAPFLRDAIAPARRSSSVLRDARRGRRRYARAANAGGRRSRDAAAAAPGARTGRRRSATSAGELSLEQVTRAAVRLRGPRHRRARRAPRSASACPGREPQGFAVIAMGKLGSRELNYSSDVDLLLLFDPETLPRRSRDDAGEAAVRIGRRIIELLQKRTEDGYVAAGRSAASAVARSHADRAAGERGDFALRIERSAVGARGLHPRPRCCRRPCARAAVPRRDPAVRLAPLARLRRDRGGAADLGADPRPFRSRRA